MKTRRNFLKLMLAIPAGLVLGKVDSSAENIISNAMENKISRKKNMEKSFTLWQLPSQGPTQMLSYVIKSANGKIIVIDGGMTCDGTYLKKVLASHGNHVDSWFLTHPHEDHIDALTWILSNQGDLKIDKIFASFPPLEWIKKYEKGNAHTLEEFTAAMKKAKRNYIKLNPGDIFNIDGVKVEILSDVNLDITVNAINNASIIMKVSDQTKSVLFLNDLGLLAGNKQLKLIPHGKLKSDYVQMAHHGQDGVGKNFYEVVQPEYCLWPTPVWLWNNDNGRGKGSGKWMTLETREWMEELNVESNFVSGLSFSPIKIFSTKNYKVEIPDNKKIDPLKPLEKFISLGEWKKINKFNGWKTLNAKNEKVLNGVLSAVCEGDCQVEKSVDSGLPKVNLNSYKIIEFRMKRDASDTSNILIFYGMKNNPELSPSQSISIPVGTMVNDGKFHVYQLSMLNENQWKGKLEIFRLDPTYKNNTAFEIDYIRLGK